MIVTLTPNPGFDRTMLVERLGRGEVHRALSSSVEAGGKGINVARALAAAGVDALALFPANDGDARQLLSLLDGGAAVPHTSVVPIDGAARSNLSVIEHDGTTTKFNEAGPKLDVHERDALIESTMRHAGDQAVDWVASCGSVPDGCGDDFHAALVETASELEVRVAIDASGAALTKAIAARPALIKPNTSELAEVVGRCLRTIGDVVTAAHALVAVGIEQVLVSLGADGAVLADEHAVLHAWSDPVAVRNTVGAGDAMLAGFLSVGGLGEDALRTAVAWGAAAVQSDTTAFAPPAPGAGVTVHVAEPDLTTVLGDT